MVSKKSSLCKTLVSHRCTLQSTKDRSQESLCCVNHQRKMWTHACVCSVDCKGVQTHKSYPAGGEADLVKGWSPTMPSNRPHFAIISLQQGVRCFMFKSELEINGPNTFVMKYFTSMNLFKKM